MDSQAFERGVGRAEGVREWGRKGSVTGLVPSHGEFAGAGASPSLGLAVLSVTDIFAGRGVGLVVGSGQLFEIGFQLSAAGGRQVGASTGKGPVGEGWAPKKGKIAKRTQKTRREDFRNVFVVSGLWIWRVGNLYT
jgi:hypothetical protein